jgi:hypothetical protein
VIEEDDSLELYPFIAEHNVCNSLGIDVQEAYEVYKSSNDFLLGKSEDRKMSFQKQEKLET